MKWLEKSHNSRIFQTDYIFVNFTFNKKTLLSQTNEAKNNKKTALNCFSFLKEELN